MGNSFSSGGAGAGQVKPTRCRQQHPDFGCAICIQRPEMYWKTDAFKLCEYSLVKARQPWPPLHSSFTLLSNLIFWGIFKIQLLTQTESRDIIELDLLWFIRSCNGAVWTFVLVASVCTSSFTNLEPLTRLALTRIESHCWFKMLAQTNWQSVQLGYPRTWTWLPELASIKFHFKFKLVQLERGSW